MKIIKVIISLFILFSVASCHNEDEVAIPNDLIPEIEMINVLTDVCKVEARFQRRLTVKELNNVDMAAHNYTIVFKNHNISLIQFKDSYSYYENNPQKMQELFDQVIIQLTEEESQLKEKEG
jgi:hypothetical protein